ncbi:MAG: sugar-binding protein [Planctomycetota bacterium]
MRHWAGNLERTVEVQEITVEDDRRTEHLVIGYGPQGRDMGYDYWRVKDFPVTQLAPGRSFGIRARVKSGHPVQLIVSYGVQGTTWSGVMKGETSRGSGQWETIELVNIAEQARASVERVIRERRDPELITEGDQKEPCILKQVGFDFVHGYKFGKTGEKAQIFVDDVVLYDEDLYRGDEDVEGLPYRLAWAVRASRRLEIDGRFSQDEEWTSAPALDGFSLPGDGPQEVPTEGRLLYDDEALYIGMRCQESPGKKLKAECTMRDGNLFRDDSVEVFLAPPSSNAFEGVDVRSRYFHIAVNARGARYDAIAKDRAAWNADWTAATFRSEGEWQAEIALPFRVLGARPAEGQVWRFNLCRDRTDPFQYSSWAPLPGGFHDTARFGYLVFATEKSLSGDVLRSMVLRQELRNKLQLSREELENARAEAARLLQAPETSKPLERVRRQLEKDAAAVDKLENEVENASAEELMRAFAGLRERTELLLVSAEVTRFNTEVCHFWRDAPPEWPFLVLTGPAMTNEQVVPGKSLPQSYHVAKSLSASACRGEYEPLTFSVCATEDLQSVEIEIDDLRADTGEVLGAATVDVRVVKCWYQAGRGEDLSATGMDRFLVPELLLKDERLVVVDRPGKRNLLRAAEGLVDISDPEGDLSAIGPKDTETLQAFDVAAPEIIKQVWLTIHVPDDAMPGTYRGNVHIRPRNTAEVSVPLSVEVLPFNLEPSMLEYSIYYRGCLKAHGRGSISSEVKSPAQFLAEMKNMLAHGVDNPAIYRQGRATGLVEVEWVERALALREEAGLPKRSLYTLWAIANNIINSDAEEAYMKKRVARWVQFAKENGYGDVYFYGIDEAEGDRLASERRTFKAVHEAGGKVFVAVHKGFFPLVGDLLDLPVHRLDPETAKNVHGAGHRIYCYGSPHVGREEPLTFRRNYGLVLWKTGYDGAMSFAYQSACGHIWNDFDNPKERDIVFAYPTVDGVIDTVQWEGFREGVDDVRYVSTLLAAIERAKDDPAKRARAIAAEKWLDEMEMPIPDDFYEKHNWPAGNEAEGVLDETRREITDWICELVK